MSSDQHRSRHGASTFSHRPRHDATYAPSSASSSDHSDRGTSSHHSSSRRVLAHVLARKERESNKMHQLLQLTFAKLDDESQRATDAERRATECLVRARSAIDARAQADADAAAARTELAMYKMQLEQAQREVSRAQELLDGLEARRHDAEEDAARARSVARKLQEERSIETAREEGKQQGWQEGLRQGILLGRREAENELGSRRHGEEEGDRRFRSRRRGPRDTRFTQVTPATPQRNASERSSPDDLHPRGVPDRRTPEIGPIAPVPSVPIRAMPFRHSPEQPNLASIAARRHNNRSPEEQLYDSSETSPSPQSRSRSRPRLETLAPEPARSRPYTPHDDSTPSIIQPIPIPASASSLEPLPLPPSPIASPVRHPTTRIPPDNWIPHAQDAMGDGHLSIFLPPPHELIDPVRVPEGPYAIAATPEDGSPAIVPPPPILSPSPGPGNRRSPDYEYATPPPPDLGPAVRTPKASRSRDYVYSATPPPPDLRPASRTRDYLSAQLHPPPPPDLGPANEERSFLPPQRIAQITSNHSRASTHLSEFDLLGPVDQQRRPSNIGPPPAEEDELEYTDVPTEPIPRQPIAPDPSVQRRRVHGKRPYRGPPRPRNIVFPPPLSQDAAQFPGQPQSQHIPPPTTSQQPGMYMPPPTQELDENDAILHSAPTSSRPKRSHTQSSIGISVEPPSPEDSPPSSGNKTQHQPDLLSPEHAERPLPMATMERFLPRNKPQPPPPLQFQQQEELTALPELVGLRSAHGPAPAYAYEAAPVPVGIEYPISPLQAVAYGVPRKMVAGMGVGEAPLSPLNVPSGFFGIKRLPWRRNTAK